MNATTELFDATHGEIRPRAKISAFASRGFASSEQFCATREERLLHIYERTLVNMANGGVYDQLAGGFHRYSVDEPLASAAFRENVLR